MSLFLYADASPQATIEAVGVDCCVFCAGALTVLQRDSGNRQIGRYGINMGPGSEEWQELTRRCRRCGWWCYRHERNSRQFPYSLSVKLLGNRKRASLQNTLSLPMRAVRRCTRTRSIHSGSIASPPLARLQACHLLRARKSLMRSAQLFAIGFDPLFDCGHNMPRKI